MARPMPPVHKRIPGDGASETRLLSMAANAASIASMPTTGTLTARPFWQQRLESAHAHAVIGGEHALHLVAKAGEPGTA